MTRRVAALAASAVLALAGCGSDDRSGDDGSSGAETTAISGETECPPEGGAEVRATSFEQAPPMCIDEAKTLSLIHI